MAFTAPISVRGTIDPRQPAFKTEGLIQTEPGQAKDGGTGVFPAECAPQHPDWWHLSGSRTRGPFTRMGPLPSLGHIRSWLCSPNCINAKDWPRRINLPPQVCHLDCDFQAGPGLTLPCPISGTMLTRMAVLHVGLSAETACSPGRTLSFSRAQSREKQPSSRGTVLGIMVCVCECMRVCGSNPSLNNPPSTSSPDTTPVPSSPNLRIRREPQSSRGVSALLGATVLRFVLVRNAWPGTSVLPSSLRLPQTAGGGDHHATVYKCRTDAQGRGGRGQRGRPRHLAPSSSAAPTPGSPSSGNSVWGVCQRRRYRTSPSL